MIDEIINKNTDETHTPQDPILSIVAHPSPGDVYNHSSVWSPCVAAVETKSESSTKQQKPQPQQLVTKDVNNELPNLLYFSQMVRESFALLKDTKPQQVYSNGIYFCKVLVRFVFCVSYQSLLIFYVVGIGSD